MKNNEQDYIDERLIYRVFLPIFSYLLYTYSY